MLWTSRLGGEWIAEQGVAGTVPGSAEAYAASAGSLAVLGYGTTVTGYQARTGQLRWQADLPLLVPGSVIVTVRAWPTAVAVGVSVPTSHGGHQREEIILSAATGTELQEYPAADYGGAVQASQSGAVIVGAHSVTSYANATGSVLWRRDTGKVPQAWTVSGQYLFFAQSTDGYLSSSPVTALVRIDMQTGAREVISPAGPAFDGTLTGVVDGVALFSGSDGLSAYSAQTGRLLWRRASAVLELIDHGGESIYVATGAQLTAVNVQTGKSLDRPATAVSASLYAVKDGVALGLDENALGEAWGYSMAKRRAVWTSAALPYPHFFVDLTGLGGSVSPGSAVTLLTECAAQGPVVASGAARCLRPELAAIQY